MWKRNLLFIGLVLGAAATLWANLLPSRITQSRLGIGPAANTEVAPGPAAELADGAVVSRIDEAFRADWSSQALTAAPPAPELTVFRRLTLALTGRIPSLEEIRRFEARPPGRRLDRQVVELLGDRRFADYFAERLARTYVGT
jgi:hypothetical protein